MVTACMVNIWLYHSADMKVLFGTISWVRTSSASRPPTRKKEKETQKYMMPTFLWSTVVSQLMMPVGACGAAWAGIATVVVAAMISSVKRLQVRHDVLELLRRDEARGHQRARLDRLRVRDPLLQAGGVVREHAGGDGGAAGDVGQIGREPADRGGAADGVATGARPSRHELLADEDGRV